MPSPRTYTVSASHSFIHTGIIHSFILSCVHYVRVSICTYSLVHVCSDSCIRAFTHSFNKHSNIYYIYVPGICNTAEDQRQWETPAPQELAFWGRGVEDRASELRHARRYTTRMQARQLLSLNTPTDCFPQNAHLAFLCPGVPKLSS